MSAGRASKNRHSDKAILGYTDKDIFKILEDLKPDVIALGYDQRVSEEKIEERLPGAR